MQAWTHTKFYQRTERYFEKLNYSYASALKKVLNYRVAVAFALIPVGLATYFIAASLQGELAPLEDRNWSSQL